MKKIITKTDIKVPFYDLDPMGIVWHGNYVKYIEVARCDFFKRLNYTYENMLEDGIMFPVAKMDLKFIKSAHFGQDIVVETELIEIEPALIFKYKIYDKETSEKLFSAKSMQMAVEIKTGETAIIVPNRMKQRIEAYED